jgi:outer membrane biosynthesis protein TonB
MTWILLAVLGITTARTEDTSQEQVFVPGQDGVTVPTLISKVEPTMPEVLERDHLQASVRYYVNVKSDGSVKVVSVLSCGTRKRRDEAFSKLSEQACEPIDQHARKAVSQWRYKPAMKNGKPVTVGYGISVTLVPASAH